MSNHLRFKDDDAGEYQPTDSEDELSEKDKELLKKARTKRPTYSDSEDEVLGVGGSESSDQSDIALSDVEGQADDNDFGIPDPKAWGKKKRNYYSTDYVDPDYGGFQGKDATLAELEEEEARNLQKELAKSMDDDDFSLGLLGKVTETVMQAEREEVVKTDVSLLSKRQKLQLLQKESPEFFGLVEDYETKIKIVQESLYPVITLWREKKVGDGKATEFLNTYYELILDYCTNIYMYLLLKANKTNMQNHPVIKRLYQYRQLFTQMDPIYNEVIKPQLELLMAQITKKEVSIELSLKKKKTLKLLSKMSKEADVETKLKKKKSEEEHEGTNLKKTKKSKNTEETASTKNDLPIAKKSKAEIDSGDSSEDSPEEQEENVEVKGDEVGKRGITYQIAKNKGLMPHRKKEQRNPRVKHRNKFRKAKIRRKGAVREVRRELSKYGGEISGIKATVSKSIKIKS